MTDDGRGPDAFAIPTVEELDAMRTALGLSQRDLSRAAGLEQSRFNDILHNDLDPHVSTMRAFLDVLQDREPEQTDRRGPKPSRSPNATDDDGLIEVCPRCDEAKLRHRSPNKPDSSSDSDALYRCANCGQHCDEPARREPKDDPGLSGLAQTLDDADPDLVTDGGRDEFPCALCGARYGDRGAALRCCTESARQNQPTGATDEAVRDAVGRVD